MSLGRTVTIDTYARDEGAYGLIVEYAGQAPILLEIEGCDSSHQSIVERIATWQGKPLRWCIVRLVPVEGNELLLLDFERLQSLKRKPE
jgi:hypothetical protein